jgi:small subunit ribosomal protein S8
MSMNDLISDTLTRIRNGQSAKLLSIKCLASKMNEKILTVLEDEGYIESFSKNEIRKGVFELEVRLKYKNGDPAILSINRVSKPGRKVYYSVEKMNSQKWYNGLGVLILSTSSAGVISDRKAKELNIGGEVICNVY